MEENAWQRRKKQTWKLDRRGSARAPVNRVNKLLAASVALNSCQWLPRAKSALRSPGGWRGRCRFGMARWWLGRGDACCRRRAIPNRQRSAQGSVMFNYRRLPIRLFDFKSARRGWVAPAAATPGAELTHNGSLCVCWIARQHHRLGLWRTVSVAVRPCQPSGEAHRLLRGASCRNMRSLFAWCDSHCTNLAPKFSVSP